MPMKKPTDIVNKKIVGVKALALYELNLTDGTTQIHQLADKVQVTMDMPFQYICICKGKDKLLCSICNRCKSSKDIR